MSLSIDYLDDTYSICLIYDHHLDDTYKLIVEGLCFGTLVISLSFDGFRIAKQKQNIADSLLVIGIYVAYPTESNEICSILLACRANL